MEQTFDILPLGNNSYLWSIGFIVCSLVISLWNNDYIKAKKDLLFFIPLSAFLAATLHSVRIGIDTGTAFIIASIVYAVWNKQINRPKNYMWFLFAYFIAMAISILWSENITQGLYVIRRSLPFVTFSVAWSMFNLSSLQWKRLLLVFFRASFLFVIISIGTSVYFSITQGFDWLTFWGLSKHPVNGMICYELVYAWTPYNHPSYNAYELVIGLICGFYLICNKIISYIESLFYALLLFVLLIITQSRIGIGMYAIVVLIATVMFIRTTRWKIVYACVVGIMAIVAAIGWLHTNTFFSLDDARVHIFQVAAVNIKQHPLLGVGIGSMADALQQDEICQLEQYGNPHNQLLGDWFQGGIISVVALLFLMGYLFLYAIKNKNMEMLLLVIISIAFMQIEMPLNIIKGLTTFVAFVHLFAQNPNDRYNSR